MQTVSLLGIFSESQRGCAIRRVSLATLLRSFGEIAQPPLGGARARLDGDDAAVPLRHVDDQRGRGGLRLLTARCRRCCRRPAVIAPLVLEGTQLHGVLDVGPAGVLCKIISLKYPLCEALERNEA